MLGSSSRGRRLPMLLILLAIVVAMAVVAIGVAFSGGGMAVAAPGTDATIEATPFSVASSKIGEEYAVCPGQQRALGGGVVQSGGFAGEVAASGPLAETKDAANTVSGDIAKRWYAAEVNGSANQQSYKVFAICSANSDATIEATPFTVEGSATGKLEDSKTGQEYAVCPPNKRALGGGVVQSGPPDALYVRASGPLAETKDAANTVSGDIAKRWYAAVTNLSKEPRNLKVFAICSANSDATIEAAAVALANGQDREEYAVCPPNKRALGGGVVQSGPPDNLFVQASGPLAETKDAANTVSGDIAKRWYAWVVNFPYGGPMVNLKVFAICSSAPPGPGPAPGPGPTPPPKVISTVPTANAKGVSPTANITATFSKDMVDSSINPTTFKLFKKGTKAKLQAAVSYSAATDKATLDPTNSLQSGATYRALVTTGAKDLAGNPLDQKHKWFFTVS
jgi:Bacterial Ig-like domain